MDGVGSLLNVPEADRIEQVAKRIAAFLRLKQAPPQDRRIVILMPDYPGAAPGRTGYAVGLDVPQSVLEMLRDLADAGYAVSDIPDTARALLDCVEQQDATVDLSDYRDFLTALPAAAVTALNAT